MSFPCFSVRPVQCIAAERTKGLIFREKDKEAGWTNSYIAFAVTVAAIIPPLVHVILICDYMLDITPIGGLLENSQIYADDKPWLKKK